MKNVLVRNNILFAILLLIFTSCRDNNDNLTNYINDKDCKVNYSDKFYYLDIVGDSSLDTVIVSNNELYPSIRDIFLIKEKEKYKIISITPWRDSTFVLTHPPVETIYLEANNVQTNEKGLRIIIRNTDFIPDYLFIDLYYKDIWIIEKYILLNTNTYDELFIKHINIDAPVFIECGEDLICNPKLDINYKYFMSDSR